MDSSIINMLPIDLVEEILARVAKSSMNALFNAKLSCTLFNGIANSEYIYRHVSLDRLPLQSSAMRQEAFSFYLRCMVSGNPDVFYREGLVCFLDDPSKEIGSYLLNKAASLGHAKASYILGINLICNGSENDKQQGMKLLGNIKTSRLLRECRNDLKYTLSSWNISNKWSIRPKLIPCPLVDPQKSTPQWLLTDNEEDGMRCQICRWNLEINYVDCILHGIGFPQIPGRCERIIEE